MKKAIFLATMLGVFFIGTAPILAQEKPQKAAKEKAEGEKAPALYDYEPGYLAAEAARRAEIERIRLLIDSMDIPASRRFKLIRDLYKSKESKRLNKVLLTKTQFEDNKMKKNPD
ncbi:hypothetical protein [Muriicola sp. Z0-33]|uniref:hypothetical protein n=1 Tax=Muriicola sp. Z0-33 TaxID=2816957 RepID=UPI002238499E|nr:hypothetical protein [Muriicola sp. Z0-33]MCW5515299.1 hypothetical protein [Muriicola sp. Z0-33]